MPHEPDDVDAEVAELEEEKEAQVLEREGLEEELMDEDRSEVGEEITGVQEE
ncbi:MAG: hypothetical protein LC713_06255 [Actinobacteria bacterium]|nr:hypothetical protein [Actinomycetota bacterium]